MTPLDHPLAAFGRCRAQDGVLASAVQQEDAGVVETKAGSDEIDGFVEQGLHIPDRDRIPCDLGCGPDLRASALQPVVPRDR